MAPGLISDIGLVLFLQTEHKLGNELFYCLFFNAEVFFRIIFAHRCSSFLLHDLLPGLRLFCYLLFILGFMLLCIILCKFLYKVLGIMWLTSAPCISRNRMTNYYKAYVVWF